MSDFATLGMDVDSRGLTKGQRELRNLERQGDRTERQTKRATGNMGQAFKRLALSIGGVVSVAATLGATLRAAGQYQSAINGLRGMGQSADQARASLEAVGAIAERTRAPLEATSRLYRRISVAANELGASNQEVLRFTENVGLALAAQGGSASEASGALLQLSQAMAGGVVRAEEFNSILEGALPIAQAAADGIDGAAGSVGRLRIMVNEGKVSSDAFFNAILSQTDELEEAFANTEPTISQALTVMRNNFTMFIGEMDSGAGVTGAIASGIIFLSENIDQMTGFLIAGASAFAASYVPAMYAAITATGGLTTALGLLRSAIVATGIGVIVVGAGMLINKFIEVSKATGGVGEAFEALKEIAVEVGARIPLVWQGVQFKVTAAAIAMKGNVASAFAGMLELASKAPQGIVKAFEWAVTNIAELFKSIGGIISRAVAQSVNFVIEKIEGLINKAIQGINKLIDGISNIPGIDIASIGDAALGRVAEGAGGAIAAISDFSIQDVADGIRDSANEMQRSSEIISGTGDVFFDAATRPLEGMESLRTALENNKTEAQDIDAVVNELSESMGGADGSGGAAGAAGAMSEGMDDATKAGQTLADKLNGQVKSAVGSVADAFGDFVARGFKDFKGFARSVIDTFKNMLSNMIAMAARNRIMISLGLGGGGGGATSALAGGGGGGGLLSSVLGGGGSGGGGLGGIGAIAGAFGGGFGNAAGALFGSGGGLGTMFSSIGAQVGTAAATGTATSIAAAAGAVALPLAAVAAAVSLFVPKIKELDRGIRVTADGLETSVEQFRKIEKSRLFGLIKSRSTNFKRASDAVADPIRAALGEIQGDVMEAARVMGTGASAFEDFSYRFKLSLKGMSEEERLEAVNKELAKMGDEFASLVPGFSDMNSLLQSANEALKETFGLGRTRFEAEMLVAAQRRGEITTTAPGPGASRPEDLIRLQSLDNTMKASDEKAEENNRILLRLLRIWEGFEIDGVPRGPVVE